MSNFNFNTVILGGRITKEPELRQTQQGTPVCSFTVAVNRYQKENSERRADFINCVAWKQTAEFISRYFRKGSAVCVTGQIMTRSWEDNSGQKRYATEVGVKEASFVDSVSEAPTQPEPFGNAPQSPTANGSAQGYDYYNPYTNAQQSASTQATDYSGLTFPEQDDNLPF